MDHNPFLNPLVLRQMFIHCDHRTVKTCRVVCRLWESELRYIFPIKKWPMIVSKEDLTTDVNTSEDNSNNVVIDETTLPFQGMHAMLVLKNEGVKINFLEIQSGSWTSSQIAELFILCSELECVKLSKDFTLPKIKCQKLKGTLLPSITSLHFDLSDGNLQNLGNSEFLSTLFEIMPNLGEVTCDQSDFSSPGNLHTTLFSSLLFKTTIQSCHSLNHLDINSELTNQDLEMLEAANFPLTSLHLPIDSRISSEILESLLHSLRTTLRKLKLTHRNTVRKVPRIDTIINLDSLAIHGTGSTEILGLDNRIRYRRRSSFGIGFTSSSEDLFGLGMKSENENEIDTSNMYRYNDIDLDLQKTIYHVFHTSSFSIFPDDNEELSFKEMKELQITGIYYLPKDVLRLRNLFPNLQTIRLSYLDDFLLREVIRSCPSLESFGALDGFFTDSGLTGISMEVQDLINEVSHLCHVQNLREFPSLSQLKNIRKLELSSPRVTDFGVIHGIICCPSVQQFILSCPQITDASLSNFMARNTPSWDTLIVKSGSFSSQMIQKVREDSHQNGRFFSFEQTM